ncbi:MAG: DUF1800 family protein [Ilumatobacter sp.]|nr:DUF1800 family protein [Ilumatobacter sp.]
MPELNESNVRHLLRRTEFVDRQDRVDELLALASLEAAVDNVLAVPANPPSVVFRAEDSNWLRGEDLKHFWLNRMAHDSARPLQEKMSLFWHGHFVSEFGKVGTAELMREQIDLFRTDGLTDIASIARSMSLQVAMLRYLDNNRNEAESPNQNFARELMELFLLGVGNYNEGDVEAATAAWTGHSDNWQTGEYVWRDGRPKHPWEPIYHDSSIKHFLGATINVGGNPEEHGFETIDVILGRGIVPADADVVGNRGRRTRDVAAEFLSRKLWVDFADEHPPDAVITAMRTALVAGDFDVVPWVRTMLTRDEFYADSVKAGLVRSPIDWVVSVLYAIGARSDDVTPTWLMTNMGQEPLRPPNVSGWKTNGYYVNASAMEARARACQSFNWRASREYWRTDGTGYLEMRNGRLTQAALIDRSPWPDYIPSMTDAEVVDTMLELLAVRLTPGTRQRIVDHVAAGSVWERRNALLLILLAPELHTA